MSESGAGGCAGLLDEFGMRLAHGAVRFLVAAFVGELVLADLAVEDDAGIGRRIAAVGRALVPAGDWAKMPAHVAALNIPCARVCDYDWMSMAMERYPRQGVYITHVSFSCSAWPRGYDRRASARA